MYCGRLDEVFVLGGGESSLSGDFSLFMCFLSQDLIGVTLASSSSSMMASLSGSSVVDLETLAVITSSSHQLAFTSHLLISSLIGFSGCSDCCLDLLHLTA